MSGSVSTLNYATLGLKEYEVFPHEVNEGTKVDAILKNLYPYNKSSLWLVSETTTLGYWIKG